MFAHSYNHLEANLSRVIQINGVGKERNRLTRATVLALRELAQQSEPNSKSRDLVAFMIITLEQINQTVEDSVLAWEKRGYWIKADRYRLDWSWTLKISKDLRQALLGEDWEKVAQSCVDLASKLNSVKLPKRLSIGTPWDGAWEKLAARQH
jgi:hypothetical protein